MDHTIPVWTTLRKRSKSVHVDAASPHPHLPVSRTIRSLWTTVRLPTTKRCRSPLHILFLIFNILDLFTQYHQRKYTMATSLQVFRRRWSSLISTSRNKLEPATQQPVPPPIQRLPSDLLAEIFTYCIPEMIDDDWRSCLVSNRSAPLLLCRVSSLWRSVAISTPRLWHTFIFEKNVPHGHEKKLKSLSRGIRSWLGRSGTLPLTIRFLLHTNKDSLVTNALKPLFEFSSRWDTILIDVSPHVRRWPTIKVLPNLRDFHGSILRINEFPFASAPNLKCLRAHSLTPNSTSISKVPWSKLTELTVTLEVPITAALELFQSCPLLEKLSISVGSDDGGSSSPLPPLSVNSRIKLDALRWLWLYITPASGVAVDYLTLPALEELHLCGTSTISEPYCYSHVLNLLTRSRCQLRKQILMLSKFTPHQLLEYLKHPSCQTLVSLNVEESDDGSDGFVPVVGDEFLSQLMYSDEQDRAPLCPKLADLSFKLCYRSEVDNPLGRMVQSRYFGRALDEQLKSLDLFTRYPISPEDIKLLELARDSGLKLSYASQPKEVYYSDWYDDDYYSGF
ncbi:hypothetical protein APHAL10511_005790 [Amanita phalloides]|nr:hypothetical protein APHAL10511_005790 [Amanita phalloides]